MAKKVLKISDWNQKEALKKQIRSLFLGQFEKIDPDECEICSNSVKTLAVQKYVLHEEFIGIILKTLLMDGVKGATITRSINICEECFEMFERITEVYLSLNVLMSEFKSLRRKIGRQIIRMSLSRPESEWKEWLRQLKTLEVMIEKGLCFTEETKEGDTIENCTQETKSTIATNSGDAWNFHPIREDDQKLFQMIPVVVLERLEDHVENPIALSESNLSNSSSRNEQAGIIAGQSGNQDNLDRLETIKSNRNLKNYSKKSHSSNGTKTRICKKPKRFPCAYCNRSFSKKSYVVKHMANIHENIVKNVQLAQTFIFDHLPNINLQENQTQLEDTITVSNSESTYPESSVLPIRESMPILCNYLTKKCSVPSNRIRGKNWRKSVTYLDPRKFQRRIIRTKYPRKFPCYVCQKLFTRREHARRHNANVHDRPTAVLSYIFQNGKKPEIALNDEAIPADETTNQVNENSLTFYAFNPDEISHAISQTCVQTQEQVNERNNQLSETNQVSCSHCDLTFKTSLTLRKHKIKMHFLGSKDEEDFQCHFCLKFFAQRNTLERHIFHVHEKNFSTSSDTGCFKCFMCHTCPRYSKSQELLEHEKSPEHQKELTLRVSVYCNICKMNFSRDESALASHLESNEHKLKAKAIKTLQTDQEKFCIPCRIEFSTAPKLKKHFETLQHRNICDFRENIATTSFEDNTTTINTPVDIPALGLQPVHTVKQVNLLPVNACKRRGGFYRCPYNYYCDRKFSKSKHLRRHLIQNHGFVHLLGGSLKACPVCFQTFTKEDFERHMEIHAHLKCPTCGKHKADNYALNQHLKSHHS